MNNQQMLSQGWKNASSVAHAIAKTDRALSARFCECDLGSAAAQRDFVLAAQSMHLIRTRLRDDLRFTRFLVRTTTEPGFLLLLHRQQIVARVLAAVAEIHAPALARGREILAGGDCGAPSGVPHTVRVVRADLNGRGRRR